MNIVEVDAYRDVSKALVEGADIVVRENKRFTAGASIGDYCHVMTYSDDLMKRIKQELGWPLVNAINGHLTFLVSGTSAEDVIASLESLPSPS